MRIRSQSGSWLSLACKSRCPRASDQPAPARGAPGRAAPDAALGWHAVARPVPPTSVGFVGHGPCAGPFPRKPGSPTGVVSLTTSLEPTQRNDRALLSLNIESRGAAGRVSRRLLARRSRGLQGPSRSAPAGGRRHPIWEPGSSAASRAPAALRQASRHPAHRPPRAPRPLRGGRRDPPRVGTGACRASACQLAPVRGSPLAASNAIGARALRRRRLARAHGPREGRPLGSAGARAASIHR